VSKWMKSSILPDGSVRMCRVVLSRIAISLTSGNVDLDGVVDLDGRVGVSDTV
jgi:hypothetical protein